jgi:hypothetical protein
MPYCPLCRSEYRTEVTRCADCDVDLAAERPTAQHPDDGWVEVFRGTAVQADIAVSRLDAQDIETLTPDEYTATLGWYAPNMSHAIRVLVRAGLADQAKKILAEPPPPEEQ